MLLENTLRNFLCKKTENFPYFWWPFSQSPKNLGQKNFYYIKENIALRWLVPTPGRFAVVCEKKRSKIDENPEIYEIFALSKLIKSRRWKISGNFLHGQKEHQVAFLFGEFGCSRKNMGSEKIGPNQYKCRGYVTRKKNQNASKCGTIETSSLRFARSKPQKPDENNKASRFARRLKNIGAKEFALGFEQLTPSLKGLSPSMN